MRRERGPGRAKQFRPPPRVTLFRFGEPPEDAAALLVFFPPPERAVQGGAVHLAEIVAPVALQIGIRRLRRQLRHAVGFYPRRLRLRSIAAPTEAATPIGAPRRSRIARLSF